MRTAVGWVLVAGLLVVAGCGDDGGATAGEDGSPDTTAAGGGAGTGTVTVRLEPVEGVFIEGFEVGLRFSTPDGQELDRTLWSEFVASTGTASIEAYYDSILEQPVPAGPIVVEAAVSVGAGPPPVTPDLDATELPCRLEVDVPDGGRVDVEVSFDASGCLRER